MNAVVQIVCMLCIVALCALLKFDGVNVKKIVDIEVRTKK